MSFNNDEPIVDIPEAPGKPTSLTAGLTQLTTINNDEAPLEETPNFKVLLELTGAAASNDRPGVDLVTVLDISGSMQDESKLEKLKVAMRFLIKKLSPIDRLSVVTFNGGTNALCPLRQITEKAQGEIESQVNGLKAGGSTNIAAGLRTGLDVLNGRRLTSGRTVAIMLMTDGQQDPGTDAAGVPVGNVPVYTFGFGSDYNATVLMQVAQKSNGGTFSIAQNIDNLSLVFSQCLAGLLTVVVQDLKVTVTHKQMPLQKLLESTLQTVTAGNYPQTPIDANGSITVSFGDLYSREVRKLIVDLLLPEVPSSGGADILDIKYTYSTSGGPFNAFPVTVNINRSGTATTDKEKDEVAVEMSRLSTARMMKAAREMADEKKLEDAKDKLVEAENLLEDVLVEHPLIDMLKTELQQMFDLMRSQDVYDKKGRPFALSSEVSHDRQRFAARGDDVEQLRLFATPRMDTYLEQAKAFVKDPSKPVPTEAEDVKNEIAADPLGPIAGALSYYIQTAIQSLKAIDNIITSSRGR